MTTIRTILNTAKWRDENLGVLTLVIAHRGAPEGRRSVAGSRIEDIGHAGVRVRGDLPEDTFVPYHRVLEIRDASGTCVWDRVEGLRDLPAAAPSAREDRSSGLVVTLDGGELLTIDGSAGEGGGQILRTSLALSILTGTPFRLVNIRAGRRKPGLKRQHLTCIEAAAAVSGAVARGASLHSGEIHFEPSGVRAGEYAFDVGTAGSAALVFQTIALPLALGGEGASTIEIRGGTHAKWAPPVPFLEEAWLPLVRRMGLALSFRMERAGFFPAGGGIIKAEIQPASLREISLCREGKELDLEAHAIVSDLSEGIARRELLALQKAIAERGEPSLHAATVRSPGPGNACWLIAGAHGGGEAHANVFSAFGEKNLKAEDVALQVASQFERWESAGVAADEYLADQLLLPMALAGAGSFTTTEPSLHTWTNIEVIAAFGLPRFRVAESEGVFTIGL